MRFTSDLQLDPTFGSGGYIKSSTSVSSYIPGISLEIDNQQRLLVSGGGYLSRYLSNGSLDTTFGSQGRANIGGIYYNKGFGTGLQPDGRILAATSSGIYRMNPDGSSPSRIISGSFRGIQIWEDGDMLAVDNDFDIHRYTRDAVKEQSFELNFGTSNSILELPDNRMLIVGHNGDDLVVSRHLASGALDTTFGSTGRAILPVLEGDDVGYRASLQADGRILISGYAHTGNDQDVAVARLNYDGTPDTSFFTGYDDASVTFSVQTDQHDYGYTSIQLQNGKILTAGLSGSSIFLARMLGDTNQNDAPTNQPPVNSIPAEVQTTVINTPLAFTEYRNNGSYSTIRI